MRTQPTSVLLTALALGLFGLNAQSQPAAPAAGVVQAVKAHDVNGVKALLKKGADANVADFDGTSALMLAVLERDPEMIDALLKAGARVDAANRYGATPLRMAARNGDALAASLLLKAGADPGAASAEGETALMAAALTGNVDLIKVLLESGDVGRKADPNAKESWQGQTALMWAAAEGHAEAISALVAAGARVDEFSAEISVPLVNPARKIGGAVYSNIPKGRLTALHFAARNGHVEAVRALVQAHANLDLVDADLSNALVLAALNGHTDAAVELLNAGADPNIADKYGRTVLFVATDMNTRDAHSRPAPIVTDNKSYVDVVRLALEKGAKVDATLSGEPLPVWVAQGGTYNPVMREGATSFLRASMSADLEIMRILLKAGANPLAETADDPRPSSVGPQLGRENVGKTTPLMAAAGVGWRQDVSRGRIPDAIEAIKMLVALGGKINQANQGGNTPLHGAVVRGEPALVEFLLSQGADPSIKNTRNLTAMDLAVGQADYRLLPNQAVVDVLQRRASARLSSTAH